MAAPRISISAFPRGSNMHSFFTADRHGGGPNLLVQLGAFYHVIRAMSDQSSPFHLIHVGGSNVKRWNRKENYDEVDEEPRPRFSQLITESQLKQGQLLLCSFKLLTKRLFLLLVFLSSHSKHIFGVGGGGGANNMAFNDPPSPNVHHSDVKYPSSAFVACL